MTEARFAILTNGIEYKFYTDIEKPNCMDERPFFEFSMEQLDTPTIAELKKFSKSIFDLDNILSTASELKYKKQITAELAREWDSPSEDLVKLFAQRVYAGKVTASVKEQFSSLVKDALRDFVKERVAGRLQSALAETTGDSALPKSISASEATEADKPEENAPSTDGIVTTQEEMQAHQIIRAILAKHIEPERVTMRDAKSYCAILLDDNNRKPICRLHFDRAQKQIGLFDAAKNENRVAVDKLTDLFVHEQALLATVNAHDPQVVVVATPEQQPTPAASEA